MTNIEIIGDAVIRGITVPNKFASGQLSPVDLMGLSDTVLNTLYQEQSKLAVGEDNSLLKKTGSTIAKTRVELIRAIFEEKSRVVEENRNKEKIRREKEQKLGVLKALKTEKELKALGELTIEQLDAAIEEAEKA